MRNIKREEAVANIRALAKRALIHFTGEEWKRVHQELIDAAQEVDELSRATPVEELLRRTKRFELASSGVVAFFRKMSAAPMSDQQTN